MLQQSISQSQQQLLSVDQRQSLQILAYTNQELDSFLAEEYMQNPLLDCKRDRHSEIIDTPVPTRITTSAMKMRIQTDATIYAPKNPRPFTASSKASSVSETTLPRNGSLWIT